MRQHGRCIYVARVLLSGTDASPYTLTLYLYFRFICAVMLLYSLALPGSQGAGLFSLVPAFSDGFRFAVEMCTKSSVASLCW